MVAIAFYCVDAAYAGDEYHTVCNPSLSAVAYDPEFPNAVCIVGYLYIPSVFGDYV